MGGGPRGGRHPSPGRKTKNRKLIRSGFQGTSYSLGRVPTLGMVLLSFAAVEQSEKRLGLKPDTGFQSKKISRSLVLVYYSSDGFPLLPVLAAHPPHLALLLTRPLSPVFLVPLSGRSPTSHHYYHLCSKNELSISPSYSSIGLTV